MNKRRMPKLRGESYGDFTFLIGLVCMQHFSNREQLESLVLEDYDDERNVDESYELISFSDALEKLTVTLSVNMDYYRSNLDELEKDLGRKMSNFDESNAAEMKSIESELFYNLTVQLCGEEGEEGASSDEKLVMFKEFKMLFRDGNDAVATAYRDKKYFIFWYTTS